MLRQVDNFALACTNQALADKIYDTIGQKLQLQNEDKPPFAKMGLINNLNGIDVLHTQIGILKSPVRHTLTALLPPMDRNKTSASKQYQKQ